MRRYNGGKYWIASDVITRLYAGKDPTTPINFLLRELLGLATDDPVKQVRENKQYRYDVSGLAVGESKMFDQTKSFYNVKASVMRYSKRSHKTFEVKATFSGTQVTRVL